MSVKSTTWQKELAAGLDDPAQLDLKAATLRRMRRVTEIFPFRISPHVMSLIDPKNTRCPIRRQVIPSIRELDQNGSPDPLDEEPCRVGPGLVQRFNDRLLALVSASCPVNCRHCNRKRNWKKAGNLAGPDDIARWLSGRRKIREVILSGGEPLLLSDRQLDKLLEAARSSNQIEIVRIHSRAPFSLPSRITSDLLRVLKRHQPLWMITQFNHARELSAQADQALRRLRSAGIPVLNQAVLLRGVNDSVAAQVQLGRVLVSSGVKPHYLFQLDRASGTLHFQVPVKRAMQLIGRLQRNYSGLLVPHLVIDLPGREGKVPISPSAFVRSTKTGVLLKGSAGRTIHYQDTPEQPQPDDSPCSYLSNDG